MKEGRQRAPVLIGLLAAVLVAPAACDPPPPEVEREVFPDGESRAADTVASDFPLVVEDHAGRKVRVEEEPRRVVALVPSVNRILVALDAGDRLVGRTDYDRDPELASLPSVGGGLGPSTERLVSLDPDLVIRFRAESDPETPERLDAAGIPHVAVRPDRIQDVLAMVELVGRVVGRAEAAAGLRHRIVEELDEVSDRVADVDRPRAAYLLGGDPPMAAGGGTFLHELVEIAGAENVLAETVDLYAPVAVEDLLRRRIDVLFVTEGARIPPALGDHRVIRVPAGAEAPGPTVAETARHLARELHPDRVP